MKMFKKFAAISAATVMAVSMMLFNASASTPDNWTITKLYGQPTSTVIHHGVVTNLGAFTDDAIDFECYTMSNNYADVKMDITATMKKYSNSYAFLYNAGNKASIEFNDAWCVYYADNGYKCDITGWLINDISTTYTATGSAR